MASQEYRFWCATNGLWLTVQVPPRLLPAGVPDASAPADATDARHVNGTAAACREGRRGNDAV